MRSTRSHIVRAVLRIIEQEPTCLCASIPSFLRPMTRILGTQRRRLDRAIYGCCSSRCLYRLAPDTLRRRHICALLLERLVSVEALRDRLDHARPTDVWIGPGGRWRAGFDIDLEINRSPFSLPWPTAASTAASTYRLLHDAGEDGSS